MHTMRYIPIEDQSALQHGGRIVWRIKDITTGRTTGRYKTAYGAVRAAERKNRAAQASA